jgi:hypothetical protein
MLQAQKGLISSVLKRPKATLPVPHSSTLCRRRRKPAVDLPRRTNGEPLAVAVNALVFRFMAKASGRSDVTAGLSDARGESCMVGSIRLLARLRRPLRATTLGMDNYLSKSMPLSLRLQAKKLMTRGSAKTRSILPRHKRRFPLYVAHSFGSMAIRIHHR